MRKLFGTDGIRGTANTYPITAELALLVGKATAVVLGRGFSEGRRRVVLGRDSRISGPMLEDAIASGFLSMGMDVLKVGVMPTPAVAHLTRSMGAVCGVMITASHNPACDNGIKLFASDGFKLPDDVELEIEHHILTNCAECTPVPGDRIGRSCTLADASGRYIEFAKASIGGTTLKGIKIVVDCANGASGHVAPVVLRELGAEVIELSTAPDGLNINDGCGALHPEVMAKKVVECGAGIGIALDGDADRVIFSDADGRIVDGDRIIGAVALALKEQGKLKGDTVVVTSMSNLGLYQAMRRAGIAVEVTDVGDRYVIERMRAKGFNVGGEQSGHIIFMDHATTGDGLLSALHVLQLMVRTQKPLAELASFMEVFPQELRSFKIARKIPLDELTKLPAEMAACRAALGDSGRTVVRYSGTENKIRVLVEAEKAEDVALWADRICRAAEEELN